MSWDLARCLVLALVVLHATVQLQHDWKLSGACSIPIFTTPFDIHNVAGEIPQVKSGGIRCFADA
jgi:hypothetical protein